MKTVPSIKSEKSLSRYFRTRARIAVVVVEAFILKAEPVKSSVEDIS